jgi:hypothetical protein
MNKAIAARAKNHQARYEAWLKTLSPAQREKHEANAAAATELYSVQHDIRFQYEGKRRAKMPCAVCGVSVLHAGIGLPDGMGTTCWYVCEDHTAPCGRICLLSSEASHFGGQTMRAFADSPDCHRGRFCECQKKAEPVNTARPKNRIRIPVHPSKRRTPGG